MSAAQCSASVLGMLSRKDPGDPNHQTEAQEYRKRQSGDWKEEGPVSEKENMQWRLDAVNLEMVTNG